jgi:hypothetical protein
MTEWVLVMMICSRQCQPQYAAVFPSKAECVSKITDAGSNWSLPKQYCVPLIKGEPK